MVTQTNEQALEACNEKALTGTCREQIKLEGLGVAEANTRYRAGRLYWLCESSLTNNTLYNTIKSAII